MDFTFRAFIVAVRVFLQFSEAAIALSGRLGYDLAGLSSEIGASQDQAWGNGTPARGLGRRAALRRPFCKYTGLEIPPQIANLWFFGRAGCSSDKRHGE